MQLTCGPAVPMGRSRGCAGGCRRFIRTTATRVKMAMKTATTRPIARPRQTPSHVVVPRHTSRYYINKATHALVVTAVKTPLRTQ